MIILLPAYNEALALPELVKNIAQQFSKANYQIIVIDDGSTDNTLAIVRNLAQNYNLKYVVHLSNRGLGMAIKTGFSAAVRENDDYLVTMDADNTHPPALIRQMVAKLDSGSDVVVASRFVLGGKTEGVNFFRQILSNGANILLKIFFPVPGLTDYSSGFRAYRKEVLKKAFAAYSDDFITSSNFSCMAEIIIKLAKLGARVSEVPLHLRYDQKRGQSKIKIAKTILGYLRLIWKEKMIS